MAGMAKIHLEFDNEHLMEAGVAVYQARSMETAEYPEKGSGSMRAVMYTALGVAGEAGEVADLIKKISRVGQEELTEGDKVKLEEEVGDVLWYLAAILSENGCYLSDAMQRNLDKLAARKAAGTIRAKAGERNE